MSIFVARFFSVVFHPALVPLMGVSALYVFAPYYMSKKLYVLMALYVFFGTYVMPLVFMFLLKMLKLISSMQLANPRERVFPYATGLLFYFLTAHSVSKLPIPPEIPSYLYGGVLIIAICFLFLKRIKISMHMCGMGGLLGMLFFTSFTFSTQLLTIISSVLILAGLVGTARLVLRAHTPSEIYLGLFVGLASVWFGLAYF